MYSESSEARPHGSITYCFKLPKHVVATTVSIAHRHPPEQKSTSSWLWGPKAGEDIPGFQVHSSAAAEINSLFFLLPFTLLELFHNLWLQLKLFMTALCMSLLDCSFILRSSFLPMVFADSPILSPTSFC